MKKIGIITHYYKTVNFGGSLQAYALPFFLNKHGFDAKQICYDYWSKCNYDCESDISNGRRRLFAFLKKCYFFALNKTIHRKRVKSINEYREKRKIIFESFQLGKIPHTDEEFFEHNLKSLNSQMDFFITGSDQVFNFKWFRKAFWLDFAEKNKISYAASMALDNIPEDKKGFVKNALDSFKAIGVRENKTIDLLESLSQKKVELNVDPVFLLDKNEWDFVSGRRLVDEKYALCYFLGENKIERRLAKEYAKKHKIKLVCIPVLIKNDRLVDGVFGDINLPYASPEEFISLIKNADCIFTDSFHSCVFSIIYNKQFVVFNRDSKGSMNNRIVSLTELFHIKERFLNEKHRCSLCEVENVFKEDTTYESSDFVMLKEESIRFLLDNLNEGI